MSISHFIHGPGRKLNLTQVNEGSNEETLMRDLFIGVWMGIRDQTRDE